MNEKKGHEPTKWEKYAKGKKPSMKRRCEGHNYRDRGIYMVTMVIEGRRPLLGTLRGDPAMIEGPQKPHVELTPFGERVKACWEAIPRFYPVVEPMKLCIMPDHIHGLLFVHEKMEKHLGDVIKGFKAGTHAAARELGIIAATMSNLIILSTRVNWLTFSSLKRRAKSSIFKSHTGILNFS